jgi:hypothetical protein
MPIINTVMTFTMMDMLFQSSTRSSPMARSCLEVVAG